MADKKKLDVTDQSTTDPNDNNPPDVSQDQNMPSTPTVQMFDAGDAGNRPNDPPVNFIYYSINTGSRDRYLGGGQWDNIDNLHV